MKPSTVTTVPATTTAARRRTAPYSDDPGVTRFFAAFLVPVLAIAAPATLATDDEFDRFRLWNGCMPMQLVVETLPADAQAAGLTHHSLVVAVRSRLRAARLYTKDGPDGNWAYLYVNVNISGRAFKASLSYNKRMVDLATGSRGLVETWADGSVGTHGGSGGYIRDAIESKADEFIDAYLRVNEEACVRKDRQQTAIDSG